MDGHDAHVTAFARGPDGFVAYRSRGSGVPIVYVGHWGISFEGLRESPWWELVERRLVGAGRLVLFDKRGTGVSDPLPYSIHELGDFAPTIEEAVRDVVTVLDDVGDERCIVVSNFTSSPVGIAFAALHPDRTKAVVLIDPMPRALSAPDYPPGIDPMVRSLFVEAFRSGWGAGISLASAPAFGRSEADLARLARMERLGCGRGVMTAYWEHLDFDVRPMLPLIQAPTLVIAHDSNPLYDVGAAEVTADLIGTAEPVLVVPGEDLELYGAQAPELLDSLEAFVRQHAGSGDTQPEDRRFAVVLFTDIVGSTEHLRQVGDARWRELLDVHGDVEHRAVERFGGRVVKHLGDGLLAVFDAPSRAVRCALELRGAAAGVGLEIRAGLHAGEIVERADDISGLAVNIAARVAALAAAGDVLATRTVKDLVAGAGLTFADRGDHFLKGLDEPWRLYATRG